VKPQIFNPLKFPAQLMATNGDSCPKLKFSKRQAEIALQESMKRGELGNLYRREQRIYECVACRWWHLTSAELAGGGKSDE